MTRSTVLKWCFLTAMLVGLPMLGIVLAGLPVERYLEFPPITRYVDHAPFSWPAFFAYLVFIAVMTLPFWVIWSRHFSKEAVRKRPLYPFPIWGWGGVILGGTSWGLAWTRFAWFESLQPHTFTPLWLSYIIVINALTYRKTGRCLMCDRPALFLLLFPFSAVFWWFFEYLNRFVQNWYYSGSVYGPTTYFILASLSFSTVLPAVASTRDWVLTMDNVCRPFARVKPVHNPCPKLAAILLLIVSAAGLTGIGVFPDLLFPLLWVSPLLIIVSFQVLFKESHVLTPFSKGDLRPVVSAALAALICGVFWEMWNWYSLARWEYAVPLVHRFQIFEMPILGYAGYLPFGLECAAVVELLGIKR